MELSGEHSRQRGLPLGRPEVGNGYSSERWHQTMQDLIEHGKEVGLYSKYSGAIMVIGKHDERRLVYVFFL